jgi:hypothetical protein
MTPSFATDARDALKHTAEVSARERGYSATEAPYHATIIHFAATRRAMENFSIIFALCRAALSGDTKDGKHQVTRLRESLDTSSPEERQMLERLMREMARPVSRSDAPFLQSRAKADFGLPGELLSSAKHVPVDRESSAPLAEVILVDALPHLLPALPQSLQNAAELVVREWTNAASLERMGLEPARTCLVYGPPGTGKTKLALWLAKQLGLPVILARLDGVMSSYLGTTSRNIGSLFAYANRHKALLLLDEFDSIAKLRDDPNEIGEIKRVVNTLLQEIDRRRPLGLTVAITNHSQLLDPAIWRRFELQLELPMPDVEQRQRILERYLPPLDVSEGEMQLLSWALDGCSGSEIEEVSRALKKSTVLDEVTPFVERLQNIAVAHGDRLTQKVRSLLTGKREELIKEMLGELGMNQTRVAEALAVNRSTINRWATRGGDTPGEEADGNKTTSGSVRIKSKQAKAATHS